MASSAPAYRIGAPLLAMAGGRDTINAASTVRRIAGRFPAGQAAFHEFEEMSHWLVGEPGWENVAQLTLAWLGALMEPAPPRRGRRGSAAETVQA
jgi:alpha-beta hydrolase superfamily lysophospholipase